MTACHQIAIPYAAIVDVEKSSAIDFSETIEVKTVDKADNYSVDSYFFAYFHDLPGALDQIRDAVRTYRSSPGSSSPPPVFDTTVTRVPASPLVGGERPSAPVAEPVSRTSSVFRFTSFLRPLQDTLPLMRALTTPEVTETGDEYTHISKKPGSSFVPVMITSPKVISRSSETSPSQVMPSATMPNPHHTYPPSTSPTASVELSASPSRESSISGWGVNVPSWLKMPSRKLLASPFGGSTSRPAMEHSVSMPASTGASGVSEILSTHPLSVSRTSGEYGFFSILEAPESTVDAETEEKFRTSFAFDEKEKLLGCKFLVLSLIQLNLMNHPPRFPGIYLPSATYVRTIVHLE